MNRIKHSPAALFGLCALLIATLAAPPPPASAAEKGARKFYLTKTTHDGSQALTACASGYHMASLWEILDPSNLRYDTELGFTTDDSGSGPPSVALGWIRTGSISNGGGVAGTSNCRAWTSASNTDVGTTIGLHNDWNATFVTVNSPWMNVPIPCNFSHRAWCVQD